MGANPYQHGLHSKHHYRSNGFPGMRMKSPPHVLLVLKQNPQKFPRLLNRKQSKPVLLLKPLRHRLKVDQQQNLLHLKELVHPDSLWRTPLLK